MTELFPITISINTQAENPLKLDFSNPIVITDLLSRTLDYRSYNSEFGNNLEVVSNDDLFGIIDINDPRYSFKAYKPSIASGGYAQFYICTNIDGVRHPDLRAGMLMQLTINYYRERYNINGIIGNWGELFDKPSINLSSYLSARESGLSPLQSAQHTWTAKQAKIANMVPTRVIEQSKDRKNVIAYFSAVDF